MGFKWKVAWVAEERGRLSRDAEKRLSEARNESAGTADFH